MNPSTFAVIEAKCKFGDVYNISLVLERDGIVRGEIFINHAKSHHVSKAIMAVRNEVLFKSNEMALPYFESGFDAILSFDTIGAGSDIRL